MKKLLKYIGLGGVHTEENNNAQIVGRAFGSLIIVAVLLLTVQWQLENTHRISLETSYLIYLIVWLFFVTETTILAMLVDDKSRYLRQNWMNIAIISFGFSVVIFDYGYNLSLLRGIRFLIAFSLLLPWLTTLISFLTDSRLSTTILAATVITIMSGVIMAAVDPTITSLEDGMWWAWVTISTVGYGDIVPSSAFGRAYAGVLIIVGLGLFSVFTANFAAILVQERVDEVKRGQEEENENIREILTDIHDVQNEKVKLLQILTQINERLDHIETEIEHVEAELTIKPQKKIR